ncbi:uncharacterized protein LOC113374868 [Ctenocephalides felis]|uniref:uncharacterized protein LOC113374868 n=1 Tax=Ctenocephalides felis TaxID=7515 RepID=UPI000E6E2689|nr:uncharacterized protein LOC113374868 [Ctenocephalides felis]
MIIETQKYNEKSFQELETIFLLPVVLAAPAQLQQPHTTPVPILKQINRHNEDGSYSYGYEAADGSFKIESKYPTGEVYGKYGYIDDQGQLREVEYGATSGRGFEPAESLNGYVSLALNQVC